MVSFHLRTASLAAALALIVAPVAAQASAAPSSDTAANPVTMPQGLAAELNAGAPPAVIPFDELAQAAGAHRIRAAIVDPATLWVAAVDTAGHAVAAQAPPLRYGTTWDPQRPSPDAARKSPVPSLFTLTDALRASSATILAYQAGARAGGPNRLPFVFALLPILIIGAVMTTLMLRRRKRAAGPNMGGEFTPTGAPPAGAKKGQAVPDAAPPETRFTDVAGCDEVVDELAELVLFLRESERFAAVGAEDAARRHPPRPARHRQDADRHAPWPASPASRSTPSPAPTSSRSTWASARAASASCSRRRPPTPGRRGVHRRDRRRRPPPRQRAGRQRGAGGHAQPAAGRDGWVRPEREGGRDRRDQPARHPRRCAAPPRPVRPARARRPAERARAARDPHAARREQAARRRPRRSRASRRSPPDRAARRSS